MDDEASPAMMELVNSRMGGRLRERVEELRRGSDPGWREIAETISAEATRRVSKSTLNRWALLYGWDVEPEKRTAAS